MPETIENSTDAEIAVDMLQRVNEPCVPSSSVKLAGALDRFILGNDRSVTDRLNPSGRQSCCPEGDPEGQEYLRERVLLVRLGDLVDNLIGNRPQECHHLWWKIFVAIRSSKLNAIDPMVSIQNRFDGDLKRRKVGLQAFTSLSLFRDDVERLLRDIYGDVESEALVCTIGAVFRNTWYVIEDLQQEHEAAVDWDFLCGLGLPDSYGSYDIDLSEYWLGYKSLSYLKTRVREVLANSSAFNKYTVDFAREFIYDFAVIAQALRS